MSGVSALPCGRSAPCSPLPQRGHAVASPSLTEWGDLVHAQVFSFAAVPFVELSDQEVQQAVFTHGQRLPVPDACPAPVYELMQACWQAEAMARPSWTEIGITLQVLHEDPAQILI